MKWLLIKRILLILIIIVSISIFIMSGDLLLEDYYEYKESEKENDNLIELVLEHNEISEEDNINWKYLKSINEDIIGWIQIENTSINYPMLKDDNNLYYLKHSYNKKYNSTGFIFTTNTYPFEDFETTIYGHNMKNGTMFLILEKYLDEKFFYSHLNIKIYIPYGNYKGTIFADYTIGITTENNNIKNMNFNEGLIIWKRNRKKYSYNYKKYRRSFSWNEIIVLLK